MDCDPDALLELWYDLHIANNSNIYYNSYSQLGSFYELTAGILKYNFEAKSYLAGSFNFKAIEIEVFKVMNCVMIIIKI